MGTYYLKTSVVDAIVKDIIDCQDKAERSKLIADYLACMDRVIAQEKIESQEVIEIQKIKNNHRLDEIKTYGTWILTGVTTIGGWIFACHMANKSFRFEEDGTLSSSTSRKLFHLW